MIIPCTKCITLAVCKTRKRIHCPIMSSHFKLYLKKYRPGDYNKLMMYLGEYTSWDIWPHSRFPYSRFPSRYISLYKKTLFSMFPNLTVLSIIKEPLK